MPRHTPTTQDGFFTYSRKSSESEDRQVLSIDSQNDDLHRLSESRKLPIADIISEARSAKAPGRPGFNGMMTRLEAGEAKGIVCWKLDRLARNPVDGGRLIWAVKQFGITIITPTQTYSRDDDNMILMYIEFGMAHKYIDDLGRAVKRGLRAKAERGLYPGGAPSGSRPGYLHDSSQPKGLRGLIRDAERFDLVRRMWQMMLSGSYSVTRILKLANEDWGFRTCHGRPLSRAALYRLFANPIYCGWFEYPLGSGKWFKASHEAMVTEVEFELVQTLLGSKGRPRRVRRMFAFTGLIRCADCGGMVTAEEKHQMICPCRHKFTLRNRDRCPHCQRPIDSLLDGADGRKPKLLHYVYYHCTKQKNPKCVQRSVRVEALEQQLAHYLQRIRISEPFERWVLARLRRILAEDGKTPDPIIETRQKAYKACLARLANLIRLKTSPENSEGVLLSDEEYATQRSTLLQERAQLESAVRKAGPTAASRLPVLEEIFRFVQEAPVWLVTQDLETKRLILAVFATEDSNLTLSDQKLRIDAPKPFPLIQEALVSVPGQNTAFEPDINGVNKDEEGAFASPRLAECGQRDDVRTYRNHEVVTKQLRPDAFHPYGETGIRLLAGLRHWLTTLPEAELVGLRGRLGALFAKLREQRRAA